MKLGKATQLQNLCREIRIQMPSKIGKVYEGLNTITGEYEFWMCIKVKKGYNKSIMQRVFKEGLND